MTKYYLDFMHESIGCLNREACRNIADKDYCLREKCNIAGSSGVLYTKDFHHAMAYLAWSITIGSDSQKNWAINFSDNEAEIFFGIEKTKDGFLCDLYIQGESQYQNFPVSIKDWFYFSGKDDRPCLYWGEREGLVYVSQHHYVSLKEILKLISSFKEKGTLTYSPDCWVSQKKAAKRLDDASNNIQKKIRSEVYPPDIIYWKPPEETGRSQKHLLGDNKKHPKPKARSEFLSTIIVHSIRDSFKKLTCKQ